MSPNNLDELTERTTVNFPRPFDFDQVKEMLSLMAQNEGYDIRCNTQGFFNARSPYEGEDTVEEILIEDYASDIAGLISRVSSLSKPASFKINRNMNGGDYESFTSLTFETIPGYSIEEHNEDEVKIWDDVRGYLREIYFEEIS